MRNHKQRENLALVERELHRNGVHRFQIRRTRDSHLMVAFTDPAGRPRLLTIGTGDGPRVRFGNLRLLRQMMAASPQEG